jgi:hypothetical protein
MDKIEIIDLDDEDDEDSEDEDDEEVEEEYQDEVVYDDYKESLRKKTDRELLESIALRLVSLERNVKQMQDDLVDTYNLLVESESDEEED